MVSEMGYNGLKGGSLCHLRASMLLACGRRAEHRQANRVLKKVVEADATSLRIRLAGSSTLRYFQVFGVVERDTKQVNLYNLGCLNSHTSNFSFLGNTSWCLVFILTSGFLGSLTSDSVQGVFFWWLQELKEFSLILRCS